MKFIITLLMFVFNSELRSQMYLHHRCSRVESQDEWRVQKQVLKNKLKVTRELLNLYSEVMQETIHFLKEV